MRTLFQFFSSLRLTVVLLALSMALIFFGTLDQVEYGIWHVQKLYFESFIAVWSYPDNAAWSEYLSWLHIPMPGGYLLGAFLFLNLIAAHFTRFKLSVQKSGIFLIHFGLILLLISEFLTDILAVESQMPVDEGGRSNYSENYRKNELVFVNRGHPDHDIVHSIPTDLLRPGETVDVPDTPLSIRTVSFYRNAQLGRNADAVGETPADSGAAVKMDIVANPRDPIYSEDEINTTTAYVEVLGPDKEPLGTWLVSNVLDERYPPQMVRHDGESWEIALRYKRHYHPFDVELLDFSHDRYPGTDIPFNFSSEVRIHHHEDPSKDRKALIYMNHPLRYEGLTFYQASFANQDQTSIFQVVRNPGWLLPYVSVLLMGLGMMVQFGMHFFRFIRKRKAAA